MCDYKNISILGIPFNNFTMDECLSIVINRVDRNEKTFIVTANPETVSKGTEDEKYKDIILKSDIIVPDGIGIVFASKILKTPLKERVAGFDLMTKILSEANDKGLSCYFYGAEPTVIDSAVRKISEEYSKIVISGFHHGYSSAEEEINIIEDIREKRPDFIFVALGMPKQEKWIGENIKYFEKGVFIGVGGSIDVIAGKVKRAPDFIIKLHLEWLYRILLDFKRWGRSFELLKFSYKILKIRYTTKNKIENM